MKRLLLLGWLMCFVEGNGAPPRPLPYPPSKVLTGLTWSTEPHLYPGIHSDMHWQTWGADDVIYSMDGDGAFPGTTEYYASLSRIIGTPPEHRIELVTQFRELRIREDHTPDGLRRYFCGPLAVGTNLYVCLYDYDWRIPGKDVANRQDFLAERGVNAGSTQRGVNPTRGQPTTRTRNANSGSTRKLGVSH